MTADNKNNNQYEGAEEFIEYEGPELFELGNVEELTFGPNQATTPDAHGIQYTPGPVPC